MRAVNRMIEDNRQHMLLGEDAIYGEDTIFLQSTEHRSLPRDLRGKEFEIYSN